MLFSGSKDILRMFRSGNVIVAGHKGRGKDLLFSYVINERSKAGERYAANIDYKRPLGTVRPITYYGLKSNGQKNFIAGKFEREEQQFVEKEDYYISDAGVALPAHASKQLDKAYPTLPAVYALSRHLGDFCIHANAQEFGRIWNKLREQADYGIYCEKCIVLFKRSARPIVFQRVILYDRIESAEAHILPYVCPKKGLILKRKTPEGLVKAAEFNARYGLIKRVWFWHRMPAEHYDTRAFYQALYKQKPPVINKNVQKQKK